jgi:hypothetical protein
MSDLSTYLTLENDTPYTLDLASKSIDHGHWTTDPPSTIDALKASPFTLTDDSAAENISNATFRSSCNSRNVFHNKLKICYFERD